MDIVSQFKKGYKTSEFWAAAFTALAPFITFISGKKIDTTAVVTFISMAVPAVSYIVGRSWLKGNRLKAAVTLATGVVTAVNDVSASQAGDLARPDTALALPDGVVDGGQDQVAIPVVEGSVQAGASA